MFGELRCYMAHYQHVISPDTWSRVGRTERTQVDSLSVDGAEHARVAGDATGVAIDADAIEPDR